MIEKYRVAKRKSGGELLAVALIDVDLILANAVAEKLNSDRRRTREGFFIVEKEGE